MRDLFQDFTLSRYMVLLLVLACLTGLLYLWGFFRLAKNITFDCLMDHKTGYYTINNLSRYTIHWAFLFVFVSTHYNVSIKPAFKITTIPLSEIEYVLLLGFIIGAEAVKRMKTPTNQTIE
ncbi:hypothetical protein [Rufibacter soli]